jgi:hypothetical protein
VLLAIVCREIEKSARLLLDSGFSFHFVVPILDILESVGSREE